MVCGWGGGVIGLSWGLGVASAAVLAALLHGVTVVA